MTDENTPLRELVDRSGYAFNMAVAETVRRSGDRHLWRVEAEEIPWSRKEESGFVDVVITRDRAVGIIECKKVNNDESLVFLTRHDQGRHVTRCRLEVYVQEVPERDGEHAAAPAIRLLPDPRFLVGECNMPTGSPESGYCVAKKGSSSANLNLDGIASHLLESCEGLLGDWDLKLPGSVTACIPIIVTNAKLWTCTFDPAAMDLGVADLPPEAAFQSQPFVRFRKAFRRSAGLFAPDVKKSMVQVVEQGERTVFVVDARHLVPFLAGLRSVMFPRPDGSGSHQLVAG
jgi:hypothetical protein